MNKPEITITCFFTSDGEDLRKIIYSSFYSFLQRELAQDSHKLVPPAPSHV